MTLKRRILDYTLAGILLLLPLVIFRASVRDPGDLTAFDRAVLRLSSPLQAVVGWVVDGVGGTWSRYVWLVDVEEENRELREENEKLRMQASVAMRRATDTQQLEDLLLLKRRAEAETIGARVIASSVNEFLRVTRIKLDRTGSEVDVGMPVVDSRGLVGVVRRAFGNYSDVMLVSDADSEISVVIPRNGARGDLYGLGLEDSYRCKLRVDKRSGPVEVGDVVVTKDLGAFPGGIEVGVVSSVSDTNYHWYQEAEVAPVVDFGSLSRVMVVLSPPPPPDPDGDEPAPAKSAYRVGSF